MIADPAAKPGHEPAWFEKWFGEEYLSVYPHRDGKEAETVIALLRERLAGRDVDRVLDLACGAGRHSRALAKHWWTTGLDLSQTLLFVARREAPEASYVRGDMRVLPFRAGSFSLVVNLFTSFGYFSEDADHRRVLAEVAEVTRKGGSFVLDYLNAEQVMKDLKPCDERVINGVAVEQKRALTADRKYVEKTITLKGKGASFVERVRLFTRPDLERLVGEAGFDVSEIDGDYRGAQWTPASSRTMLFCQKR
jgi:SAM-dependent methyltransferase